MRCIADFRPFQGSQKPQLKTVPNGRGLGFPNAGDRGGLGGGRPTPNHPKKTRPKPRSALRRTAPLQVSKSKLFADLFHKTFFPTTFADDLQHFLFSTVTVPFCKLPPKNSFMKHLSLTSKTNLFNTPPKSFFALSLFNICLQHLSQNTASFFAATFHTNLQNSSGILLANRHLRLLCKTALKKSCRTCIFVILSYNFSESLSLTALSKTDHYSETFELPFVPVFVLEAPHFIAEFATTNLCFQRRKKLTSSSCSSKRLLLVVSLKPAKKKKQNLYTSQYKELGTEVMFRF